MSGATQFGGIRMVRTPRFKLIARRDGPDELYDLVADPGERTNLVARECDRSTQMARWLGDVAVRPVAGTSGPLSARDRERLRVLGYLD